MDHIALTQAKSYGLLSPDVVATEARPAQGRVQRLGGDDRDQNGRLPEATMEWDADSGTYKFVSAGAEARQFINGQLQAVDLDENLPSPRPVRPSAATTRGRPVPTMSTADGFVPAQPGSWTLADREAASREVQHAVAAVLFGVEVLEVRIDKPG